MLTIEHLLQKRRLGNQAVRRTHPGSVRHTVFVQRPYKWRSLGARDRDDTELIQLLPLDLSSTESESEPSVVNNLRGPSRYLVTS